MLPCFGLRVSFASGSFSKLTAAAARISHRVWVCFSRRRRRREGGGLVAAAAAAVTAACAQETSSQPSSAKTPQSDHSSGGRRLVAATIFFFGGGACCCCDYCCTACCLHTKKRAAAKLRPARTLQNSHTTAPVEEAPLAKQRPQRHASGTARAARAAEGRRGSNTLRQRPVPNRHRCE